MIAVLAVQVLVIIKAAKFDQGLCGVLRRSTAQRLCVCRAAGEGSTCAHRCVSRLRRTAVTLALCFVFAVGRHTAAVLPAPGRRDVSFFSCQYWGYILYTAMNMPLFFAFYSVVRLTLRARWWWLPCSYSCSSARVVCCCAQPCWAYFASMRNRPVQQAGATMLFFGCIWIVLARPYRSIKSVRAGVASGVVH